jgi:tRNA threonylcarbamoyl adenosine modification protein YjeE
MIVRAPALEDTEALAKKIARALAGAIRRGEIANVLVGLTGELGAGKTAFVRGFVAAIDPARARDVASPSYAIAVTYAVDPEIRHLDLYRLETLRELEAIGWRDLYFAPGIALVEWIEKVPDALPAEWLEIRLAVDPTDVREIDLQAHGERLSRILTSVES